MEEEEEEDPNKATSNQEEGEEILSFEEISHENSTTKKDADTKTVAAGQASFTAVTPQQQQQMTTKSSATASGSRTKSTSSRSGGTSGSGSNPNKKPDDMPRRPLSAYNIYFKDQREIMIRERELEIQRLPPGSKRPKLGFENMAKIIGARWKRIDPPELKRYKALAEQENRRYRNEMDFYLRRAAAEISAFRGFALSAAALQEGPSRSRPIMPPLAQQQQQQQPGGTSSTFGAADSYAAAAAPYDASSSGYVVNTMLESPPLPLSRPAHNKMGSHNDVSSDSIIPLVYKSSTNHHNCDNDNNNNKSKNNITSQAAVAFEEMTQSCLRTNPSNIAANKTFSPPLAAAAPMDPGRGQIVNFPQHPPRNLHSQKQQLLLQQALAQSQAPGSMVSSMADPSSATFPSAGGDQQQQQLPRKDGAAGAASPWVNGPGIDLLLGQLNQHHTKANTMAPPYHHQPLQQQQFSLAAAKPATAAAPAALSSSSHRHHSPPPQHFSGPLRDYAPFLLQAAGPPPASFRGHFEQQTATAAGRKRHSPSLVGPQQEQKLMDNNNNDDDDDKQQKLSPLARWVEWGMINLLPKEQHLELEVDGSNSLSSSSSSWLAIMEPRPLAPGATWAEQRLRHQHDQEQQEQTTQRHRQTTGMTMTSTLGGQQQQADCSRKDDEDDWATLFSEL